MNLLRRNCRVPCATRGGHYCAACTLMSVLWVIQVDFGLLTLWGEVEASFLAGETAGGQSYATRIGYRVVALFGHQKIGGQIHGHRIETFSVESGSNWVQGTHSFARW